MATAFAEAAKVARLAEDRRERAATAVPRAIQRAFDHGIELVRQISPSVMLINSGSREDRAYNVVVHLKLWGVEPGVHGQCTCEGAWLGGNMCQHLAYALLLLGRIDQYGKVLPRRRVKRQQQQPDVATLLARKEKFLHRWGLQMERAKLREAAEQSA